MAGRKPGTPKTGGRQKGTPNKATAKCREVIAAIGDDMASDFTSWLYLTASGDEERGLKPDPKGAADLYLKAIEYHIPKLARSEVKLDATENLAEALKAARERAANR